MCLNGVLISYMRRLGRMLINGDLPGMQLSRYGVMP